MSAIRPEFVEFIPKILSPGVLFISERYRTASHLCACGCGEKVVTPLSPARWRLVRQGDYVSLTPSIGNWDYACRSHYWIRRNEIVWSGRLSSARIALTKDRDRQDCANELEQRNRAKQAQALASAPRAQPNASEHAGSSLWDRLQAWIARVLGT